MGTTFLLLHFPFLVVLSPESPIFNLARKNTELPALM